MTTFRNQVTKVKGQGHIQTLFDIRTLSQKLDVMSNEGFPVDLQF